MRTSDERRPQSNAKSAGSTTDTHGDAAKPVRCLSTAGDLSSVRLARLVLHVKVEALRERCSP